MAQLILNSPAKVNLYLQVLNKRKDNFHNLETIFERISLCDRISLKLLPGTEIMVSSDHPGLPGGSSNLAFRAARLLQDTYAVKKGVEIRISKRIPIGAGLGGGSSNAAAVLLGLNKLWKLGLKPEKLAGLAAKIGSDAAFFIYGIPFAEGKGRGEIIRPLAGLKKTVLWHVLVVPEIHVSTPVIYKKFKTKPELTPAPIGKKTKSSHQLVRGLTSPRFNVKIISSLLKRKGLASRQNFLFNSLEEVTLRSYPEVARCKDALRSLGLKAVLMSGSGSAVFGIAGSRKEAVVFSRRLKKIDHSWKCFAVRTY